jgi:hypothetical protein
MSATGFWVKFNRDLKVQTKWEGREALGRAGVQYWAGPGSYPSGGRENKKKEKGREGPRVGQVHGPTWPCRPRRRMTTIGTLDRLPPGDHAGVRRTEKKKAGAGQGLTDGEQQSAAVAGQVGGDLGRWRAR